MLRNRTVKPLCEAQGIDAVDRIEQGGGFGGLVRLQMADQMNFGVGDIQVVETGALGFEFLNTVFAKESDTGVDRVGDGFSGVQFRDGHEAEFVAAAIGATACSGDAVLNRGKAV